MSVPIKNREQKGKVVVINEGIVHAADGNGCEGGLEGASEEAKECAKLRTNRTNERAE